MNMKKTIQVCALMIAVSGLFAGAAFAAANDQITTTTVFGGGSFSPSNKVMIKVTSTDSVSYQATSGHTTGGTRTMGSSSADPKIYWQSKEKSAAPADTTTDFSSGWTTL